MKRRIPIPWPVWLIAQFFFVSGCATTDLSGFPAILAEGIPNFNQVSPQLYRGAQPNTLGMKSLQKLGVRTIINLRAADSASPAEKDEATALGITYINLPMNAFLLPKSETVSSVLSRLPQAPSPVFVHCQFGRVRTGTVIACYRMTQEAWANHQALHPPAARPRHTTGSVLSQGYLLMILFSHLS